MHDIELNEILFGNWSISVMFTRLVSELIPNYVFHCISLHWVSDFPAMLLNHLRF